MNNRPAPPFQLRKTIKDSFDFYRTIVNADISPLAYKEAERDLCRFDLFYLLAVKLKRKDVISPWLFDRCREVQADPNGYLDLWGRDHYKSTIITYALTIQDILNDPEDTICIFSHTAKNARKFLRQIKNELATNIDLKFLFDDILWQEPERQAQMWSEDAGIVVKRKTNPKEPTLKSSGLVDGQPTGDHFRKRIYDDTVTQESVSTPDQIEKTTEAWEMSISLGTKDGDERYIGTRYCTIGDTRILMDDWSHKKISEISIGETVVGWKSGRHGKRYLEKSKVIACGVHRIQPVNKYTFSNGRSVTCTADHLWWRGPHWAAAGKAKEYWRRGREYGFLGFGYHELKHIRQLLVPKERDNSWQAGWLAGFFDGEGTIKKNKGNPSGSISFTQSVKNQCVIDKFSQVMSNLGFKYSISICNDGSDGNSKSFHFNLHGGWDERYRFLNEISPSRKDKLAETLFAQLHTDRLKLTSIDDAGFQDVYWLETETGNYIAEGFCSKNSLFDTYAEMMKRKAVKPRIYAATHNSKMDGNPVFFTPEIWKKKLSSLSRSNIASQYLQNPMADEDATFSVLWLKPYEVRPRTMNVYIMCDPSKGLNASSDNTAIMVVGVSSNGGKYLLDGYNHRMTLSQRWVALKNMYQKWSAMPGVQNIQVGYERYGAQSDDEYFTERMKIEDIIFPIEELSWTREGGRGQQGKRTRVERLEPDFRNSRFYLPLSVWHENKPCTWKVDNDPDSKTFQSIIWSEVEGFTKLQQQALDGGSDDLISKSIRRVDEENKIYDLAEKFMNEYMFFPFGEYVDALDATSRIYDMDVQTPMIIAPGSTENKTYFDS